MMRHALACLVLPTLLACTAPLARPPDSCGLAFSNQGHVRVFVVGHFQHMADNATYRDFDRAYRRHLERLGPCFSRDRPNLVVFPEDAGLGALLLGKRNIPARAVPNSTVAFLLGAVGHAPGMAFYQDVFPGISLARSLLLSASDPVWRATQQTFGGLARDFGVWVALTVNVANTQETLDRDVTRQLKDPDAPWGVPAHRAVAPEVFNQAVLFAPDGALAGRVPKVFLTDPEEQVLDLSNGGLSTLPVWDTPFGRLGVAISRDAFYPPLMQRLEDLDVELVLQPEAFSGWTVAQEHQDEWLPDVFLSSGWLHTQKYRTFRHSLNSVYVGNFLDLTFDGQAHITKKAAPEDRLLRYVGGRLLPGFVDVGPWVMADPGDTDATLGVLQRREKLRARGEAMGPAARRGPDKNAYVDTLVAADLSLPRAAEMPAVAVERDVTQPPAAAVEHVARAGHQRHQDVASDGAQRVAVVWQDARDAAPQVRVVFSQDGGGTFSASRAVAQSVSPQGNPAVCMAPDGRGVVVWQQGVLGAEAVAASRVDVDARRLAVPVAVFPGRTTAQWEPACGRVDGGWLLAWTDFSSGPAPQVLTALWRDGARDVDPPVAVDAGTRGLPRMGASQVQPALSTTGGHLVWLDYRARSWDVFHARWDGRAWVDAQRVDGVAGSQERLHGEPSVWADGDRVVAVFGDLHDRRGASDVGVVESQDRGVTFGPHRTVEGGVEGLPAGLAGEGGLPRFRPHVVGVDGQPRVVFQDVASGHSVIMASELGGLPRRVDDTGRSAVALTRARAAAVGGGLLVTWEDDRLGPYRVFVALLPR